MATKRKMVYVSGLDYTVNEEILYAAFIPFGDIREINIPRDGAANAHRGFAFVDYEESIDAEAAIENMNGAELLGKFIKCSIAKPSATKLSSGQAVWSTEAFYTSIANPDQENPEAVE